ncbi:hypothetical protein HK405_014658, partial [Cladochytrium tenue]
MKQPKAPARPSSHVAATARPKPRPAASSEPPKKEVLHPRPLSSATVDDDDDEYEAEGEEDLEMVDDDAASPRADTELKAPTADAATLHAHQDHAGNDDEISDDEEDTDEDGRAGSGLTSAAFVPPRGYTRATVPAASGIDLDAADSGSATTELVLIRLPLDLLNLELPTGVSESPLTTIKVTASNSGAKAAGKRAAAASAAATETAYGVFALDAGTASPGGELGEMAGLRCLLPDPKTNSYRL